jgi:NADH dehydrogenase FAD-containing subunit/uncharacterized membrane protein YphA (DoxX/SURF4 family)
MTLAGVPTKPGFVFIAAALQAVRRHSRVRRFKKTEKAMGRLKMRTLVSIPPAILIAGRFVVAMSGFAGRVLSPWLDVLIRLWLAQAFLMLEILTMTTGAIASGRTNAEPFSGLVPSIAASSPDVALKMLCAVLLLLGLFSRLAACAMLVQSLLLHMQSASSDIYLFWAALLGWIVVMGPGPFSLDHLLNRGAGTSAVPGVASFHRAYCWITLHLGSWYKLVIRVWLAAAPAAAALSVLGMSSAVQRADSATWLPHVPEMVHSLPPAISLLLAVLLMLGLGTRLTAVALLILVPISQISLPVDDRLYWLLLLATLALHGPGPFSFDWWLERYSAAFGKPPIDAAPDLPHVVIVGGGFGGIAAARSLRRAPCRVTLIDQRNYHLFQPLLYQIATASLSPADIATPIRGMFREQWNLRVVLGRVTGVASATREVLLGRGRIGYDYLVLATGAQHSYFGHDDWAPFAPGLKRLEDATDIRRRLLVAFEEAENSDDPDERRAWLTFVIVGGGPTGVELAGAIAELARHGLEREFRSIEPASARVLLVQSASRLLPSFAETLSAAACQALLKLGVEVQLRRKVDQVDAEGVVIDGDRIPARTVLWAAGVTASPAGQWLQAAADPAGRLKVGPALTLPGTDNIFAIGDTATVDAWGNKPVPGLAPVAKQGGHYVAKVISARLAGRPPPPPFRYRHFGSLATIGRQAAVAELGPLQFRGALAWWIWGAAHIAFLVGARNRMTVMFEWLWAYLTFRRSTRLITDGR